MHLCRRCLSVVSLVPAIDTQIVCVLYIHTQRERHVCLLCVHRPCRWPAWSLPSTHRLCVCVVHTHAA